MVFETLNPVMQNLLIYQFESIGKILLILLPLFLSIWYLYKVWGTKEESPYILVGMFRIIFYWVSKTFLFVSPLCIFMLHPKFSFWTLANLLIIFYIISMVVGTIIIFINWSFRI